MRRRTLALAAASALLAGMAAWRTWPGLSPHSLWLDDSWVATLVKDSGLQQDFQLRPPTPLGYLALLRAVCSIAGLGEWQLQSVAWVAYIAAVVGFVWLVAAVTNRAALGVIAGATLGLDPKAASLAPRVKHFTLDLAASVALLAVAWWWSGAATLRRWKVLAASSIAALFFSFASVFIGPLMANLALLECWRQDRKNGRQWAAWAVGYNAVAAAIALGVLRRQATSPLVDYWNGRFIPFTSAHDLAAFLLPGSGWQFFSSAFPADLAGLAILIPAGAATLIAGRRTRTLGLFVAIFYVEMLAANALRLYPLGEKRLDLYSLPVALLATSAAVAWPFVHMKWVPELAAGAVLATSLWAQGHLRLSYFEAGDRSIIEEVARELRPSDSLVIFPWTNWPVGYYGPWPVDLVHAEDSTNGFHAIPRRPNTLVLPESWQGMRFDEHVAAIEGPLLPFLAQAQGRVVYLGTHVSRAEHARVLDIIRQAGFRPTGSRSEYNAVMVVFER